MERIDQLLVRLDLFKSRQLAQSAIKANLIKVNDQIISKPSLKVDLTAKIEVLGQPLAYVSRGGLKLEKAISDFNIDLNDQVVLDIGASTGGFSDVCLKNNCRYVYALDVGTDQLDPLIKNNPRVKDISPFNFRNVTKDMFDQKINFVCIDVSFISLKLIFQPLATIIDENTVIVSLIKPQFENSQKYLNKNGILKNKKDHLLIVSNTINDLNQLGFTLLDFSASPIQGKEGNQEYLGLFKLLNKPNQITPNKTIEELFNKR